MALEQNAMVGVLVALLVVQLNLSFVLVCGQDFQELWRKGFSAKWIFPKDNAEQRRQKRAVLYQGFRKTLPMWLLSNDLTVFILTAISMICVMYLDQEPPRLCFCLGVGLLGLVLRFVLATGCELSTTRDTVLLFGASMVAMALAPSAMQPLATLGRLVVLEVVPEPSLYFKLQLAFAPLYVITIWWLRAPMERTEVDFMCLLFNEAIGDMGLLIAHGRSEWTLSNQVCAKIFAEEQTAEAKSFCEAVRQLLSVTCDACSSLSCDLQVIQPSVSFLDLLKLEPTDVIQKPFCDFVTPEDKEHFQSIVSFSSKAPSSGVVHLLDGEQERFPAKVFLVQLSGQAGYFLGIAKESTEPPEGGTDMQFLLGNRAGKFVGPDSVAASQELLYYEPGEGLHWAPVHEAHHMDEVKNMRLVVDAFSEDLGYIVKSLTVDFADLPPEKMRRLPNLLEWLEPKMHMQMVRWLEEEVNSAFHGQAPRPLKEVEFLSPGGAGGAAICGTFQVASCESKDGAMYAQIEIHDLRC